MTVEDEIIKTIRGMNKKGFRATRENVINYLTNCLKLNTETINRTFRKLINDDKKILNYKRFGTEYLRIPSEQLPKEPRGNLEDYLI